MIFGGDIGVGVYGVFERGFSFEDVFDLTKDSSFFGILNRDESRLKPRSNLDLVSPSFSEVQIIFFNIFFQTHPVTRFS